MIKYIRIIFFTGTIIVSVLHCSSVPEFDLIFKGDAGLDISKTDLTVKEGVSTDSFAVFLTARPAEDVTVAFNVSDETEGYLVPQTLTFSPDNYDIAQVVTLIPLSDCASDGDQEITIETGAVVSNDKRYQSSLNPFLQHTLAATVQDNISGLPTLVVLSNNPVLQTSEAGVNDKFLVSLSCPPVQPVDFTLSSSNTAEGKLDLTAFTLDSTNWSRGRLVTVTGQSDCATEPDISYNVSVSTTSLETRFNGLSKQVPALNKNVAMTQGFQILSNPGQVNNGLNTINNFMVRLACSPVDTNNNPVSVTMGVTVNSLPGGNLLHSPVGTYIFDSTNWNNPVDVINEVLSDTDGAYTIDLTSSLASITPYSFQVGNSPTKRVEISVNGLNAGESFVLKNGNDQISFGANTVPGAPFKWFAYTGQPYGFYVLSQPNGQVCALREQQYGIMTGVLNFTVNCVNGYMKHGTIWSADPAAKSKIDDEFPSVTTFNTGGFSFTSTQGITSDGTYLYIGASGNNKITRVHIADSVANPTIDIATGLSAPSGMATDGSTLFFAERGSNLVKKIDLTDPAFPVTVVAGDGTAGFNNSTDPLLAKFNNIFGLVLYKDVLYVADSDNHRVRSVNLLTGEVKTVCGDNTTTLLNRPVDITTDGTYLYISDFADNRVVKYNLASTDPAAVMLVAGKKGVAGFQDGIGNTALFDAPQGIEYFNGFLYVSEWRSIPTSPLGGRLRKIDLSTNEATTIFNLQDNLGSPVDGDRFAASMRGFANFVILDHNMYITDSRNGLIRKVSFDLVADYPLAGDSKDYSGNGYDFTSSTGTTYTEGPHGSNSPAKSYNGSTDSDTRAIFNTATTNVTLSFWFKLDEVPVINGPLVHNGKYANNQGYGVFIGTVGHVNVRLNGANFRDLAIKPAVGLWQHYVLTNNGTTWEFYINGIKQTNMTIDGAGGTLLGTQTVNAMQTTESFVINSGFSTSGSLSDVRLYSRGLTLNEIKSLATRIPDGLVAYYPMDDAAAGTALDYSVYTEHGTLAGGMTGPLNKTVDRFGNLDSAYLFDGVNDEITFTGELPLPAGSADRTLCSWIKADVPIPTPGVNFKHLMGVAYGKSGGGSASFVALSKDTSGQELASMGAGDSAGSNLYNRWVNYVVPSREWFHVCGTQRFNGTGSDVELYVDGQLLSKTTASTYNTDVSGLPVLSSASISIGSYFGTFISKMSVDDVRIYDRVLSAKEVRILADKPFNPTEGLIAWYPLAGDNKDYSGNGYNGTYQGGTPTWITDPHGNAINAPWLKRSANQYVSASSSSTLEPDNITVSAWIRPEKYPTGTEVFGIVDKANGYSSGYFLELAVGSPVKVAFVYNGSTGHSVAAPLPLNIYSHVAAKMDKATGTITIYVNGKNIGTATDAISKNTTTVPLEIGRGPDNTTFPGVISDVRIYDRPLSDLEIARLATQVPAALEAYYPLNDAISGGISGTTKTASLTFKADGILQGANGPPKATSDRFGYANSAYRFDGVDDFISLYNFGSPDANLPMTISLWAKTEKAHQGTILGPTGVHSIHLVTENGSFGFRSWVGNGSLTAYNPPLAAGMFAGVWNHIIIRIDTANGVNGDIYVNGRQVATGGKGFATGVFVTALLKLGTGRLTSFSADFPFIGAIDDVRIYNRALTPEETRALAGYHPMQVTSWSPTLVSSSLQLHLDASTANCTGAAAPVNCFDPAKTDTNVLSWPDISGNNYTVSQGVPANQPTWSVSSIGGHPGITFNPAVNKQYLTMTNATISTNLTSKIMTTFFVGTFLGTAAKTYMSIGDGINCTSDIQFYFDTWPLHGYTECGITVSNDTTAISASKPYIFTTNMLSSTVIDFYNNGGGPINVINPVGKVYSQVANNLAIGIREYSKTLPYDGDMAEILYFNNTLTTASTYLKPDGVTFYTDREIVECYLSAKYGIPVTHTFGQPACP